jgi:ribokinase
MSNPKQELKNFLKQEKQQIKVTALPDFFLDRIISLDWTAQDFSKLLIAVSKRKGGSIDEVPQTDLRGGNAINVASALANLGAEVTPIVCTSKHGLQQIKYFVKGASVDTSHVKICNRASMTTALEFKKGNEKTNVMIRDLGSLANFGPKELNKNDLDLIESSDYTCLFNWAGTLQFGSQLAREVFAKAKAGKGKTYFDTADPSPNMASVPELVETVLKSDKIDILAVNENEAIIYASFFDKSFNANSEEVEFSELAMEAARILAKNLKSRIDLHTTVFSASVQGKQELVVPAFKIKVLRATGAGDAWTAGNIIGDFNNLSDECRLMFANAISACYLSDPEGMHPTWKKLSAFLEQNL